MSNTSKNPGFHIGNPSTFGIGKHEQKTKMNEHKTVTKRIQISEETGKALDVASARAASAFSAAQGGDSITTALAVAAGMKDLRSLFDDVGIRESITELQDTSIGFRTDRDPKVKNRKTQEFNQPYPYPVVKDCAIEAGLRGLQMVGNQWNIISGRQYTTKEGFEFLISKKLKDVTDFKPICGVPKNAQGGALVEFVATWKQAGVARDLTVTIPIKTDDYSGADQILGKAMRKGLARCHAMMTGSVMPDGDASEPTGAMQIEDAPKTGFVPREKKAQVEKVVAESKTEPATAPEPEDIGTLQADWRDLCASMGVGFDSFRDWLTTTGRHSDASSLESWAEVPSGVLEPLIDDKDSVKKLRAIHGKAGVAK